jgi:hypothetical protein
MAIDSGGIDCKPFFFPGNQDAKMDFASSQLIPIENTEKTE